MLERSLALTETERSAISQVPVRQVRTQAGEVIVRADDKPSSSFILSQGVACNSKVAAKGRQITALFVHGDMPDLHSLHLDGLDSDIWAITECRLASMAHADLQQLCHGHPRVADDLWRATLVTSAIHREWVVNLGQRQATSRLAHVFCEMMVRMKEAGLAEDRGCPLPLTQRDLSEVTGLSLVHVNRTIQELRAQSLISFQHGRLFIHDWDELAALGNFQSDYLHLRAAKGAARRSGS